MATQRIPQGPALHARDVARGVPEYGVREYADAHHHRLGRWSSAAPTETTRLLVVNDAVGSQLSLAFQQGLEGG
jgi:hypothetical protein